MISIVLADDHDFTRRGVKARLEMEPDFRIIAEAGNGLEVPKLVEDLQPDILILDVIMPGLNGLEVTRRVCDLGPKTRVIILSMYDNEAYVLEALWAGAKAYILKRSDSDKLVHAIRESLAGGHYLDPMLYGRAIEAYIEKARHTVLDLYETLTRREREALHLAAQGHTNAEISAELCISQRTAESHRANAMRKLGLNSQIDLIRYAMRRGIIQPEE
jgi:DNA-binding NarL/FixJ family response regulator